MWYFSKFPNEIYLPASNPVRSPFVLCSEEILGISKATGRKINATANHRNKGLERLSCSAYLIRKVPKNRKFLEEFPKPRDLKAGSFLINEVGRPKLPTLEVNSEPYS